MIGSLTGSQSLIAFSADLRVSQWSADPERDAERTRAAADRRPAIDPDLSGGPDRLVMPGVPPPSEHALNIAEVGIVQSDLAMGPSADPDRAERQLEHPDRRGISAPGFAGTSIPASGGGLLRPVRVDGAIVERPGFWSRLGLVVSVLVKY